jgi:hypothetical protein
MRVESLSTKGNFEYRDGYAKVTATFSIKTVTKGTGLSLAAPPSQPSLLIAETLREVLCPSYANQPGIPRYFYNKATRRLGRLQWTPITRRPRSQT